MSKSVHAELKSKQADYYLDEVRLLSVSVTERETIWILYQEKEQKGPAHMRLRDMRGANRAPYQEMLAWVYIINRPGTWTKAFIARFLPSWLELVGTVGASSTHPCVRAIPSLTIFKLVHVYFMSSRTSRFLSTKVVKRTWHLPLIKKPFAR